MYSVKKPHIESRNSFGSDTFKKTYFVTIMMSQENWQGIQKREERNLTGVCSTLFSHSNELVSEN